MKLISLKNIITISAAAMIFSACGSSSGSDEDVLATITSHDGTTIESGFLYGSADDSSLSAVEVSFDGGDFQAVTGTDQWKVALPSGTEAWLTGSWHTVTARGVLSGGSTDEVTITVRKGPNRDVNGDGYADLALGATDYNYYVNINADPPLNDPDGRVYLFHGGTSGPGTSPSEIIDSPGVLCFGYSIVLDDFNGDGYGDMAVSDSDYSSYDGTVFIYYGSATGLAGTAGTTLSGKTASSFGMSLCSGDFNGDGYTDLAVGAPHDDTIPTNSGAVYVFHGSSSVIADCDLSGSDTADWCFNGASGNQTGSSVTSGDFNEDGYSDLAVASAGNNAFSIYNGSAAGLGGTPDNTGTVAGIYDLASLAMASGDVNGDGYADLAVGGPSDTSSTGRVEIFHGSSTGISATKDWTMAGSYTQDYFGWSLSMADMDLDGFDDLAVGASEYSPGGTANDYHGALYIYRGSASGAASPAFINQVGETHADYYGTIVYFSDITGDGSQDLYVLARGYEYDGSSGDVYFGRAYFYTGTSSGISMESAWIYDAEFSLP